MNENQTNMNSLIYERCSKVGEVNGHIKLASKYKTTMFDNIDEALS